MNSKRVYRYSIMLSGHYIVNELPKVKERYVQDSSLTEFLDELHTIALERIEAVIQKLEPDEAYEQWMREKAAYSFRIAVSEEVAKRIDDIKENKDVFDDELWGIIRKG